jgi:hypothetical protein
VPAFGLELFEVVPPDVVGIEDRFEAGAVVDLELR